MRISTKIKIVVVLLIITLGALGITKYTRSNIEPVIKELSSSTIQNYCVNAVNNAAHMVIDEKLSYQEMVNIVKNNNGEIELIQANTVKINRLARDLANLAQANVELIEDQIISLPMGVLTGSYVLSGYGPPIDIRLTPVGSVEVNFVSIFDSVGINQTRHSIYMNVDSTISIVLPISTIPVKMTTAVLVCENVIIGKVPEVYIGNTGNSNTTDYLDLVPER